MLKGLFKRKENLTAKIATIQYQMEQNKDSIVDFGQMGIDHIFVDESHQFKNLMFNTRHDRVAGLGNSEGSQRALNLLYAIRTIQERNGKDLGATFLSGTTISNSLTELYLLFKYLRPNELTDKSTGRITLPLHQSEYTPEQAKAFTSHQCTVLTRLMPRDTTSTHSANREWVVGKQSQYDYIDNQQSGSQLTL